MTIQWFPGHMAKATRQISEKLKLIDLVMEVVDARLPHSSRNPMLDQLISNKPRLILLNKEDLADPSVTKKWLHYFRQEGLEALAINAQTGKGVSQIPHECLRLAQEKINKFRQKTERMRPIRALIVGIPNVGKSSLINRLAKRHAAKTGDRPGVTKGQQWIKTGENLELLDTPGILWPKFDDPKAGLILAASGAIKDEILPKEEVALFALTFLSQKYPEQVKSRYKLQELEEDGVRLMELIGRRRGALQKGGEVDLEKVADLILQDLRSGKLGPVSFEEPEELTGPKQGEDAATDEGQNG